MTEEPHSSPVTGLHSTGESATHMQNLWIGLFTSAIKQYITHPPTHPQHPPPFFLLHLAHVTQSDQNLQNLNSLSPVQYSVKYYALQKLQNRW